MAVTDQVSSVRHRLHLDVTLIISDSRTDSGKCLLNLRCSSWWRERLWQPEATSVCVVPCPNVCICLRYLSSSLCVIIGQDFWLTADYYTCGLLRCVSTNQQSDNICVCVSLYRLCVRKKTWRNGSWLLRSAISVPRESPRRYMTSQTSWKMNWPIRRRSSDRSGFDHLFSNFLLHFPLVLFQNCFDMLQLLNFHIYTLHERTDVLNFITDSRSSHNWTFCFADVMVKMTQFHVLQFHVLPNDLPRVLKKMHVLNILQRRKDITN